MRPSDDISRIADEIEAAILSFPINRMSGDDHGQGQADAEDAQGQADVRQKGRLLMAAAKKMPKAFEKADRAADKKAGVREGSRRDEKLDAKAMKKPGKDFRGMKNGKYT